MKWLDRECMSPVKQFQSRKKSFCLFNVQLGCEIKKGVVDAKFYRESRKDKFMELKSIKYSQIFLRFY